MRYVYENMMNETIRASPFSTPGCPSKVGARQRGSPLAHSNDAKQATRAAFANHFVTLCSFQS